MRGSVRKEQQTTTQGGKEGQTEMESLKTHLQVGFISNAKCIIRAVQGDVVPRDLVEQLRNDRRLVHVRIRAGNEPRTGEQKVRAVAHV